MEQIIGQTGAPADVIKDSDIQHFAEDVLAASREVPVIVDFWAPWCGPCKQLTPVLEKVVRQAGGKVKLVKVNVDENQAIAQQLRIQSIPAVFAFKDGQPVDGFAGALPESQVKAFIQRLTGDSGPSEIERALAMARESRENGQSAQAASIYSQILRVEPDNAGAIGGLAQCHIASGELDQARALLAELTPEQAKDTEVAAARAAIELAEQAASVGDTAELEQAIAADPNNHQARYDLSLALVAQGRRQEAVDQLLEIVKRNRGWNDEAARKQLVTLFEAFGPVDPLTVASRRRLSSLLFS
jgi:putative thioredoxin